MQSSLKGIRELRLAQEKVQLMTQQSWLGRDPEGPTQNDPQDIPQADPKKATGAEQLDNVPARRSAPPERVMDQPKKYSPFIA